MFSHPENIFINGYNQNPEAHIEIPKSDYVILSNTQ